MTCGFPPMPQPYHASATVPFHSIFYPGGRTNHGLRFSANAMTISHQRGTRYRTPYVKANSLRITVYLGGTTREELRFSGKILTISHQHGTRCRTPYCTSRPIRHVLRYTWAEGPPEELRFSGNALNHITPTVQLAIEHGYIPYVSRYTWAEGPLRNCGFPGCTSTWQAVNTACLRTFTEGSLNSCSKISL